MALIENPILNSPFREPNRHFKFDDEGITNDIVTGRRPSSHFVPIPRAKKKGKQLQFDTEWTKDRVSSRMRANGSTLRASTSMRGANRGASPSRSVPSTGPSVRSK